MFDIDGGWRWAFVWWKREASIRSRAETLIRMRVPMASLRRWNQTGQGQRFPSLTMRRKRKLFTPFFPLLSDESDCRQIELTPQRCNY